MTNLFISYSRKNTATARKLTAAFHEQHLEYWIDWEGIPPTVDWWKEIEKGIEEADVFLFLLSPDSAASKVCKREIEHAVRNGKRLIPVVVCDVNADAVSAEIKSLNYIFLREYDDFEAGFKLLIEAIKTDYEWVQTHRQVQVKALEWKNSNQEKSLLLRGKMFRTVQLEFASNASKEPFPTDLQREYILASKKERTRETRLLANTSLAVLFAIVWLAYTPMKSWLEAPQMPGWRALESIPVKSPQLITMNLRNPDEIYMTGEGTGEFYGSTNAGNDWQLLAGPEEQAQIVGLAAVQNKIFVLLNHGMWVSEDQARSWSIIEVPAVDPDTRFLAISINPLKENEIYIGTDNGSVYQSENSGIDWQILPSGFEGQFVHAIAVNGPMMVVATEEGLWSSNIKRNNWKQLSLAGCSDQTDIVTALAFTRPFDDPPPDGAYGFFAAIDGLGVCDADTLNLHRNTKVELSDLEDRDVSSIVLANTPRWTYEGYMSVGTEILRKRIWYSDNFEWWKLKVESLVSQGG